MDRDVGDDIDPDGDSAFDFESAYDFAVEWDPDRSSYVPPAFERYSNELMY